MGDPVTLGAGALAVSTVGGLISGEKQARAAGAAAQSQERQSQANLAFAKESRDQAVAAADSPQELAALERSMASQGRNLARSEKLLSAVDPTLMEASQQALRLLRGEEASALGPLKNQRDRQRKLLLDQLRQQLGPGAETSSAGIEALTRFDQETSGLVSGAQQQSLGQLLGSTQASSGQGRQSAAQAAGSQGQLGGLFGQAAQRKVGAFIGAGQQVGQAAAGAQGASGSQFVGQQLSGANQGQLFANIGKLGAFGAFGGGSGGSAGGAKATPFAGGVDPKFGGFA